MLDGSINNIAQDSFKQLAQYLLGLLQIIFVRVGSKLDDNVVQNLSGIIVRYF